MATCIIDGCGRQAKAPNDQALAIKSVSRTVKTLAIAERFGMSARQVRDIRRGASWAWLEAG